MKMAFYAGASGIIAQQQAMDNIGHNMANVSTTGYLGTEVSFSSLLNTEMYVNTPNDPLGGNGARAVNMGLRLDGGSFVSTSNPYDLAIMGEGFFAVDAGGQIEYTLDGTFNVSLEGELGYLTTVDGSYVLDENYERIQLVWDDQKGRYDYETLTEQVGVFQFQNPSMLNPVHSNRFTQTPQSGEPITVLDDSVEVRQSVLRNSNISVEDEMAEMITTQRAYQLSSKVIQVADENEQIVNSLRR